MPRAHSGPMTPVQVSALIGPPPPAPPGYRDGPPHDPSGPPFPGHLVAWRWVDRASGRWRALVTFRRPDGLQYEHWVGGEFVSRV